MKRQWIPWACAVLAASAYGSASHRLEYFPVRQIDCTYGDTVTLTGAAATAWIAYQLPAPSSGRQKITTTLNPAFDKAVTTGQEHRPLIFFRQDFGKPQSTLTFNYQVHYVGTLYATQLVPIKAGQAAPTVTALSARQRAYYLAATDTVDYGTPAVKTWLNQHQLHRRAGESDLDLARRCFLAIRGSIKYDLKQAANAKASEVASHHAAVCAGLGNLYCAALRANGIPARGLTLQQVWQNSGGDGNGEGHFNNEFYLDDVGWLPADPTGSATADSDAAALVYFAQDSGGTLIEDTDDVDDYDIDVTRLGLPGGRQPGDTIVHGRFCGLEVTGAGAATWKHKESYSIIQKPAEPAFEPTSARGEPSAKATGPGFRVWRDTGGWHVRPVTDGRDHSWQVDVKGGAHGPAGDWNKDKDLLALGQQSVDGVGGDFKAPATDKALWFDLEVDHDPVLTHVYLGADGDHPHIGPFVLSTAAGASSRPQG